MSVYAALKQEIMAELPELVRSIVREVLAEQHADAAEPPHAPPVATAENAPPAPGGAPETPEAAPAGTDVPPYDPDAHTVREVLGHLDGADPAEVARVVAAERAGQARSGVLNQYGA